MDYSTKGYHGTLADTAKSVIEENGFRVSSKKNEWLGTGVYFFAYRQHALDWIKHRRYKNKKTAVLSAIFEYNDIEYLDLDDPSNIDKLNATVQTIIETSEDTEFDLSSLSIEEKRNIYCNMYRRAYPNTKVISYTFSRNHEPYTVAGYKKNQKQYCVIDPSLIKNIQIEWCDENGIKL